MKAMRFPNLVLLLVAVTAVGVGCTSSGPTASEGPPETPELSPPATTSDGPAPQPESDNGGAGSASGETDEPGEGSSPNGADTNGGAPSQGPAAMISEGRAGAGNDGATSSNEAPPAGSAVTAEESAAMLDAELAASAGKFDAKMLEELRRLAAEATERTGHDHASESQAGSESGAGGGSNAADAEGDENSGGVGGPTAEAAGAQTVPPDVGDGSDDDIVARQLREAAIEEKDPELREKLWDEYRRYKASVSGTSKDDS